MKKTITIGLIAISLLGLFGCDEISASSEIMTSSSLEESSEPSLMTYYSSLEGHFDDTFKTTLNEILVSTHVNKVSYEGAKSVLAEADSYDGKNVECLYTGVRIPIANFGGSTNQWNREHTYPKSKGFNSEEYTAYADCHHLRATETSVNSLRGNKDFMEVVDGNSDSYGNHYSSTAFEPRDAVKGDVARILFYMVTRYDDSSLDLELGLSPSSSTTLGDLSTLIRWSAEDPVDAREMHRNESIFTAQGNRNPFIDYPEFVYYLYQSECEDLELEKTAFTQDSPVSESKIEEVDLAIREIGDVTVDSDGAIRNAITLYEALTEVEKSFVTEYSVMMKAVDDFQNMNEDGNVTVYDFTTIANAGYTKDKTILLQNMNFFFSCYYADSGNFRLGANAKNARNNAASLGLTSTASHFEYLKFTDTDITQVLFSYKNSYSGISKVALFYSEDDLTYEEVEEYTVCAKGSEDIFRSSFATAKTGTFILAIEGTAPRIDLFSLKTISKK